MVTQPNSFDIAGIEYFTCKKVFPSGVPQPMDENRYMVQKWNEFVVA